MTIHSRHPGKTKRELQRPGWNSILVSWSSRSDSALIYPIFNNDRVSSGKLAIRKRKLTIKTSLRAWQKKAALNHCRVTLLKPLWEASDAVLNQCGCLVTSDKNLSKIHFLSIPTSWNTHDCRVRASELKTGWGCCGWLRAGETYVTISKAAGIQ